MVYDNNTIGMTNHITSGITRIVLFYHWSQSFFSVIFSPLLSDRNCESQSSDSFGNNHMSTSNDCLPRGQVASIGKSASQRQASHPGRKWDIQFASIAKNQHEVRWTPKKFACPSVGYPRSPMTLNSKAALPWSRKSIAFLRPFMDDVSELFQKLRMIITDHRNRIAMMEPFVAWWHGRTELTAGHSFSQVARTNAGRSPRWAPRVGVRLMLVDEEDWLMEVNSSWNMADKDQELSRTGDNGYSWWKMVFSDE